MSDELEEEQGGGEINADAIAEAFSDDNHHDDEDAGDRFNKHYLDDDEGYDEDEDEDDMDTNFEIVDHDNHW